MPLINVRTNISDVQNPDALLKKLSAALASATGKPESYVMTLLDFRRSNDLRGYAIASWSAADVGECGFWLVDW